MTSLRGRRSKYGDKGTHLKKRRLGRESIKRPSVETRKIQLIIRDKTVLEFCFDSLLGCCEIGRLYIQYIRTDKRRCVLLLLPVMFFIVILTFIPKGNSSNPVIPILLAGLLWSRHSGVRYPTGWTIKWRFNPAFSSASFIAFIVFKHTSGS